MYVFVYEPRVRQFQKLRAELKASGLKTFGIGEDFFGSDISTIRLSGYEQHAILIGEAGNTKSLILKIRRSGCINPIIALHDQKDPTLVAELLNCGADDVITNPYTGFEVLSRINSIVRRNHGHVSESVTVGDVTAYFDGRDPLVSGVEMPMSKREFDIFHLLALNSGKIVSKSLIYDAIYSMGTDQPFEKVIDVYICNLRKKISKAAKSGNSHIFTIRGRGYRFSSTETEPQNGVT
jgi:two-component system cell cycle response regulator CtrA